MGENTKIQWAHHTFNPWRGCTKVAAGCANCYAESQSKRNPKTLGIWGPNGTRVVASEAMWREPVKWNRDASFVVDLGEQRPRVFCASLADVFEDWQGVMRGAKGGFLHHAEKWNVRDGRHYVEIPDITVGRSRVTLDDVRARLFRLIDATPSLDWLLLTKRPENIRRMFIRQHLDGGTTGRLSEFMDDGESRDVHPYWRRNVWLGTSIACQEDANRNIPELLKCRDLAAKLFLSIEPLVGPVDLHLEEFPGMSTLAEIEAWERSRPDWVIVGGESGPNARPCDLAWIRSIVQQCKDAGVPVFVKQLGAKPFMDGSGGERFGWSCGFEVRGGQTWLRLRDTKGGDPVEWPDDIRVREVPA